MTDADRLKFLKALDVSDVETTTAEAEYVENAIALAGEPGAAPKFTQTQRDAIDLLIETYGELVHWQ